MQSPSKLNKLDKLEDNISPAEKNTKLAKRNLSIFCFMILPFIVMYWMVPVISELTIGNDYVKYPIEQQMDLAFSLEHDSFPLYAPGFAGGQSAAALTLGQIYHPISQLARHVPGYWDGHALTINTVLRLISLGICQLLVFYMLRKLGLNILSSFILSLIAVFNLRMLDHFRYGAALENHTAFLSLTSLIILQYLNPAKLLTGIGIILCAYLLVTGGHPQISYLGFLGAALITLVIPFFIPTLKASPKENWPYIFRYWAIIFALVSCGILLAAPYILGLYFDFILGNGARTSNEYAWSLAYQDSWGGALRSLYAPLKSDANGAFGASSLLILFLSLPALLIYRIKIPFIIIVLGIISVIFILISVGDATQLHHLTWKYLPFSNNFRSPGRYSIVVIFPMLLILLWLFKLSSEKSIQLTKNITAAPLTVVSLVALLIFVILNTAVDSLLPNSSNFTPQRINQFTNTIHKAHFYLGIAILLCCALWAELCKKKHSLKIIFGSILVATIVIQIGLTLRYGTWVTEMKPQKTLAEMKSEKIEKFKLNGITGFGLSNQMVDEQLERSIIEPKMARIYRHVITTSQSDDMWNLLATNRSSTEAVIIADSSFNTKKTINPSDNTNQNEEPYDSVKLTSATYNRLVFEVVANKQSLLSTNIPYRENWIATVDDNETDIFRANGNETALFIPAGKHNVSLSYKSYPILVGGIIASSTLFFILIFIAYKLENKPRIIALVTSLILPITSFYLWQNSFYNGSPIKTNYSWSSSDFPASNNVAYGKRTSASSLYNAALPIHFYSGLAVDGDIDSPSFGTSRSKAPFWKIDLGQQFNLKNINIHHLNNASLPITVYVSSDKKAYKQVKHIKTNDTKINIDLSGMKGRFIAIQSRGVKVLAFKEVEVFSQ